MYNEVFISHAREDSDSAKWISKFLKSNNFVPWLDKEKILPGQNWEIEIMSALRKVDYIILLFSKASVEKRGFVQKEWNLALKYCEEKLDSDIFIIPCRIDDCEIPEKFCKYQWVDLRDPDAFKKISDALNLQRKKYKDNATKVKNEKEQKLIQEEIQKRIEQEEEQKRMQKEKQKRLQEEVKRIEEEKQNYLKKKEKLSPVQGNPIPKDVKPQFSRAIVFLGATGMITVLAVIFYLAMIFYLLFGNGNKLVIGTSKQIQTFSNFTETSANLNLKMIAVKGGTFTMGCTEEQGNDCYDDEKPNHTVTVSDFYIGKYEVTQAQWETIMKINPSYFMGDKNLPVERVTLDTIQIFISKLNALTGKQYRLPTEAEWEYAARGGVKSKGYKYSGSDTLKNVAWYSENSERITHPVCSKQANELGIHDMSGNVWEYCNDWYSDTYYSVSTKNNPTGPESDSSRVVRGGSWNYDAEYCRVSVRNYYHTDSRNVSIGFRLACSL